MLQSLEAKGTFYRAPNHGLTIAQPSLLNSRDTKIVANREKNRVNKARLRIRRNLFSSKLTVYSPKREVIATAKASNGKLLIWYKSNPSGHPDYCASTDSDGAIQLLGESGRLGWLRIDNITGWLNTTTVLRVWTERGGVVAETNTTHPGGILHTVIGSALVLGVGIHLIWAAATGSHPVVSIIPFFQQLLAYIAMSGLIVVAKCFRPLVDRVFPIIGFKFSHGGSQFGQLRLGHWPSLSVTTNDNDEMHLLVVLSLIRVYGLLACRNTDLAIKGNPQI